MCFNVGVIIGPLLSGFLADPIHSMPNIFGPGSFVGGADGVQWMAKFPYALPNIASAIFLAMSAMLIILGLDETHPELRHRPDPGRQLGRAIVRLFKGSSEPDVAYEAIPRDDPATPRDSNLIGDEEDARAAEPEAKPSTPFRAIFTLNVCLSLFQRFLLAIHVSAFSTIFFTLLPTPKEDSRSFDLPFRFSGGLGLSSKSIGLANTTIGMIGIPLQVLLYPLLSGRLGARKSYLAFLPLSIVAYCLLPYLVLLPADNTALVWTSLSAVLVLLVTSRTFVTPATMMLVNDCAPSPTLLGTVHGLSSSIASSARIMGPTVGGAMLGWGLGHNFVALPLWILSIVAVANWAVLLWIKDLDMDE